MTTKISTVLLAAFLISVIGCSQAKDASNTTTNGNANKAAVVTGGNDAPQTVIVSNGNNSIQVKQDNPDANNKVVITGSKGERLSVEQSDADDDDDDAAEVSDETKGSIKTTTKDGRKTTVIADESGDAIETKTGDRSKQTVIRDGKDNKVTIGPNGIVVRDRKGNKVVVP